MKNQSQTNKLTNDIIDFLYKRGIFCWRSNSTGIMNHNTGNFRSGAKKGVADILAVLPPNGKFMAIEIKTGSDRLSDEQIGFGKNIENVGGLWCVAKNFEDFEAWFYALDK